MLIIYPLATIVHVNCFIYPHLFPGKQLPFRGAGNRCTHNHKAQDFPAFLRFVKLRSSHAALQQCPESLKDTEQEGCREGM